MLKRLAGVGLIALLLSLVAMPAEAAVAPTKLKLSSYSLTVGAPTAPVTDQTCDYNWIFCGFVQVDATFSGFNSHERPAGPALRLGGSANVTRVYGCQSAAGKRLNAYNVTVRETASLDARRGQPSFIPAAGDKLSMSTYAFLNDAQPGNCPAGSTAMIYRFSYYYTQLTLDSYVSAIPSGTYRALGYKVWTGAVPTPKLVAAS